MLLSTVVADSTEAMLENAHWIDRENDLVSCFAQITIQLPGGVGISLVNKQPEELVYISLKNIDLVYSSNPHGQSVEANVAAIQVKYAK